ncbi:peptidylprolyl isomerase [Helicobacter sp. 13S00401-1]|uniref:FKBP-type peptidyl-prolyl cis-trans isomerase n=1 Tax=Helicobacter sp. 13S00401-1 TaxID=1905758 RepID=UPI000BA5796F|nr:peptidylprolyl isomerase [Helicobacter sp. 13S00401-1]PAF50276.1 peptidylprolyl isomerase [Helicobacter sp. 13S00401-1]
MNTVKEKQVVSILYTVKDADTNEIIDSNLDGKPLEFLLGEGQVISALEREVLGKNVGDKLNFKALPQDAYGERNSQLLQEVPRAQFEDIELERGMSLFGQSEDGQTVQVIVNDFNDDIVIIDYNHPLAGKTLDFQVEVLGTRPPTEAELKGEACGCGSGGGHEEGGCCGGGGGGCGCH